MGEPWRAEFSAGGIAALRHRVADYCAAAGLDGEALDDFVLAVHELTTNAVRHGGGGGTLRLWVAGGRLVGEISDDGGGFVDPAHAGLRRPDPHSPGGLGIWLARTLSDSLAIDSDPNGTVVRVVTALPRAGTAHPAKDGTRTTVP